jgi:ELWxxDGT repeat protein
MRRLRLATLWLACVSCFLATTAAEAQFPQFPHIVLDINPGSGGSDPQSLTRVGSTLFVADPGPQGFFPPGLWKSDGTMPGTTAVRPFPPGPSFPTGLTAWDGALYFAADDFNNQGSEL